LRDRSRTDANCFIPSQTFGSGAGLCICTPTRLVISFDYSVPNANGHRIARVSVQLLTSTVVDLTGDIDQLNTSGHHSFPNPELGNALVVHTSLGA
jgi:hypothetical protein